MLHDQSMQLFKDAYFAGFLLSLLTGVSLKCLLDKVQSAAWWGYHMEMPGYSMALMTGSDQFP